MTDAIITTPAIRPAPWGLHLAAGILALAGLALCNAIMTQLNSPTGTVTGGFMCGPSGQGCAHVFSSPESKLLGIPLVNWGYAYFLGVFIYLVAAGRRAAAHWLTLVPLALGGLYSGWMLVQLIHMGEFCGWCVATHLVNFLMITAIAASAVVIGKRREPNLWRVRIVGLLVPPALIVAFTLGLAVDFQLVQQMQKQQEKMGEQMIRILADEEVQTTKFRKSQPVNIPADEDDAILGPANAPVRITVFKDFECPYCKELSQRVKKVEERFPQEVCVVFKHYPLDNACNPHLRELNKNKPEADKAVHKDACAAAVAAEAVRRAGGSTAFWKYHDLLYENQNQLGRGEPFLRELAGKAGVGGEQFDAEMKNEPRLREKINRDCLLYQKIVPPSDPYYGYIPRVYLNGRYFDFGWKVPKEYFERTVQALLKGEAAAASQPSSGPAD